MARISQKELLARLEKGKAIPATLLLGEEPYLRDACRAQLIEKFVPEASRVWAVSRYSADRGKPRRWRWRGPLRRNKKSNLKREQPWIWRSSWRRICYG